MAADERVLVFSVGDVFPDVPDGRASFAPLTPLLSQADIVFGNCEGVYSDRPSRAPSHKHFNGAPRAHGDFLGEVPFHVMTCANNHMIDGGYEGLADTLELLGSQGIATTGAGIDIAAATRPAILERAGVRVAFLGFCSVYPVGYEAREGRPGLAPLRVRTYYGDPDPNFWEPGVDPVIETVPFAEDLARYRESIAAARRQADFVVVAPHWGYSSWMEVLQDYELTLARDAVEHGADAVMCCHHHALRGVEIHRGKPIFYGLGALIHHFNSIKVTAADRAARQARFGERSSFSEAEEFPLFPFRVDARKTGIAVLWLGADGAIETGFIPAHMLGDGSTEPLRAEDPRAAEVADYIERLSAQSGFATRFERSQFDGWMLLQVS
ncbi:MAG TPA: CapA family protein [Solirubrobacteraceae bacterium]|nr:CapA family protein [Solirubrobacteraceae bacterium]